VKVGKAMTYADSFLTFLNTFSANDYSEVIDVKIEPLEANVKEEYFKFDFKTEPLEANVKEEYFEFDVKIEPLEANVKKEPLE
jgi:hypothetical protein